MSVIWTLTSFFLYVEITIIVLFLLPYPSAKKWKRIFQFKPLAFACQYMHFLILGFGILFVDAVNKVRKCNNELENNEQLMTTEYVQTKRLSLFHAQRNLYISGFCLFLWLVLSRLVKLISKHGQLTVDYEAIKKQALSATEAAEKFMTKTQIDDKKPEESNLKCLQNNLEKEKQLLELANSELEETKLELKVIKSQAESTKEEYDKLLNDYQEIVTQGKQVEEKQTNKKEN